MPHLWHIVHFMALTWPDDDDDDDDTDNDNLLEQM